MEELDLKNLLKLIWKQKLLIILLVIVGGVLGFIYNKYYTTPKYKATTTFLLAQNINETDTSITSTDVTLNSKLVDNYSELIKSQKVLSEVVTNTGISITEEQLKKEISIESTSNTSLINISVKNENPEVSTQIANEIANVFTKKVAEIYNINNVQIVNQAEIPQGPSNINHKKDIIIFAFIGAVVSVIYVLLSNMLDTTVKTAEEIEKEFKLPVIASIPIYNAEPQRRNGGKR